MSAHDTLSLGSISKYFHHATDDGYWIRRAKEEYGADITAMTVDDIYDLLENITRYSAYELCPVFGDDNDMELMSYRYYLVDFVVKSIYVNSIYMENGPYTDYWDDIMSVNFFHISLKDIRAVRKNIVDLKFSSFRHSYTLRGVDVMNVLVTHYTSDISDLILPYNWTDIPMIMGYIVKYGMNRWFLKDKGEILPPNIQSIFHHMITMRLDASMDDILVWRNDAVRYLKQTIRSMERPEDIVLLMNSLYVTHEFSLTRTWVTKLLQYPYKVAKKHVRAVCNGMHKAYKARRSAIGGQLPSSDRMQYLFEQYGPLVSLLALPLDQYKIVRKMARIKDNSKSMRRAIRGYIAILERAVTPTITFITNGSIIN